MQLCCMLLKGSNKMYNRISKKLLGKTNKNRLQIPFNLYSIEHFTVQIYSLN